MRLAEEEKLRKEMSAKKAKEEAERKHQVSRGRQHLRHPFTGSAAFPQHRGFSVPATFLPSCMGAWSCARQRTGVVAPE